MRKMLEGPGNLAETPSKILPTLEYGNTISYTPLQSSPYNHLFDKAQEFQSSM